MDSTENSVRDTEDVDLGKEDRDGQFGDANGLVERLK